MIWLHTAAAWPSNLRPGDAGHMARTDTPSASTATPSRTLFPRVFRQPCPSLPSTWMLIGSPATSDPRKDWVSAWPFSHDHRVTSTCVLESDATSVALFGVVLFFRGKVPPNAPESMRLGRIPVLPKPNGGVCGIVVGYVLHRLVARTTAHHVEDRPNSVHVET